MGRLGERGISAAEMMGFPAGESKEWLFAPEVKVAQLYPTLLYPLDCSSPGSSVHGILQAKILEWVAIPFSRGSSLPRDQIWVSRTAGRFFAI